MNFSEKFSKLPMLRVKPQRALLPKVCYLLAVIVWLLLSMLHCAGDAAARAGGRLVEQTLAADAFQLVELIPAEAAGEGTALRTTGGDPQMIVENVADAAFVQGSMVRTMQVYAQFDGDPREMCLYYTTKPGEPYSQDRRVFPERQTDGSYLYTLPRGKMCSLRLDPCSPAENTDLTMTVQRIVLNAPLGLGSYFLPNGYQLFALVLYPGMAAALLSWLCAVWAAWKNHRR